MAETKEKVLRAVQIKNGTGYHAQSGAASGRVINERIETTAIKGLKEIREEVMRAANLLKRGKILGHNGITTEMSTNLGINTIEMFIVI